VGHAGTLDPFATGLLIILVGRATKLARFFVDLPKEYVCTLQFGTASDTGDRTGDLSQTGARTTRAAIDAVLPDFLGTITQRVPMTSAVKVDGERLYKKAHRGEVVETPQKQVEITRIDAVTFDEASQELRCTIGCSKGTYVRQLAIDLGNAVGAGAYLQELARTATGEFRLQDGQSLADFEAAVAGRQETDEHIPRPAPACPRPRVHARAGDLGGPGRSRAQWRPAPPRAAEPVRLVCTASLLAIYGPQESGRGLKPLVVL